MGMFIWPLPGHTSISSYFGHRASPGGIGSTNHQGIDIPAATGTPIHAAATGKVITAGYSGGYGNLVVISHSNGYKTYYGHMSSISTGRGKVSVNKVIGKVGSTGNSTGPHLHFGVMKGGSFINPLSVVTGSSNMSNYSGPGLTYAIKIGNGKTFYYNPQTKKLCTDKEGKHPIKGSVNATTGKSSGRGGSSRGSSGGSSAANPIPYTEYYYTKPQNFEDAKDEITVGEVAALEPTIRVLTIETDWQRLILIYPNKMKPNFDDRVDFSIQSLYNQYIQMINIMTNSLVPFSKQEGAECMIVTELNGDFYKSYYINSYEAESDKGINKYYEVLDQDWIDLFNELTLKRDALLAYLQAFQTYTSPLKSSTFLQNRYRIESSFYSDQIGIYYNLMKNYIKDNAVILDTADQIQNLTNQISNLSIEINSLKNELNIIYNKLPYLQNQLNNNNNMLNNLLNVSDFIKDNYFSDLYKYWNINIIKSPKSLNFWLDFLDNNGELQKYSIENMGLQQIAVSSDNINSLYNKNIPNIIYYSTNIDNKNKGYIYLQIPEDELKNIFINSAYGISAKNKFDDLLYQHTYCNQEINIAAIPIYYLEPNTRILIYNEDSHINNEYLINRISFQLNINNITMSIASSIVPERLY